MEKGKNIVKLIKRYHNRRESFTTCVRHILILSKTIIKIALLSNLKKNDRKNIE